MQVRQLASHLQQVEERERKRISRELHDEAGQSLLCLRLQLEMLENSLPKELKKLRGELRQSRQQVETIIVEIRRLISALSPTVLEQFGLVAAIRHLLKEFLRVSQAQVELTIDLPENLEISNGTSMVAYRFVQEALHNILSHSKADTVKISASLVDGQLVCQVSDNGVGFRVREVQQQDHSFGLRGISERVLLMGGTVVIASEPGEGATVTARMPLMEDPAMPGLVALAAVTRRATDAHATAPSYATPSYATSVPESAPGSRGGVRDADPASLQSITGWNVVATDAPARPETGPQEGRGAPQEGSPVPQPAPATTKILTERNS
jgi:two-component sensor histidine kinase